MDYFSYFLSLTNKTSKTAKRCHFFTFKVLRIIFKTFINYQVFDFVRIINICPVFDVSFYCMKKLLGERYEILKKGY